MPTPHTVLSLGIQSQAPVLQDDVKLQAGTNITLAYVAEHNAVIISATPGAGPAPSFSPALLGPTLGPVPGPYFPSTPTLDIITVTAVVT